MVLGALIGVYEEGEAKEGLWRADKVVERLGGVSCYCQG